MEDCRLVHSYADSDRYGRVDQLGASRGRREARNRSTNFKTAFSTLLDPPHTASVDLDDLDAGPIRRAGNIRRGGACCVSFPKTLSRLTPPGWPNRYVFPSIWRVLADVIVISNVVVK